MENITTLITGSGAPGIKGTIYSLKNNSDKRDIRIVGTDIKEKVIGTYICDAYYQISKPSEPTYLDELLSICESEDVDVLLPQNTAELEILARQKPKFNGIGIEIAISNLESIIRANDKDRLMHIAESIGIPVPRSHLVNSSSALIEAATDLGWPNYQVVVKPPVSNGMRGVRIIDESIDLKKLFYAEKPSSLYTKMNSLLDILGDSFPELLVMEYLPGDEYTVDLLRSDKTVIVPRKRNVITSGITFQGTTENNQEIIEYSRKLANNIDLTHAFGFQFKLDKCGTPKLLESNPRIQGTMVLSTFSGANIIYGSVKYALNEPIPDYKINWGTKIIRYWGGSGVFDEKIVGFL